MDFVISHSLCISMSPDCWTMSDFVSWRKMSVVVISNTVGKWWWLISTAVCPKSWNYSFQQLLTILLETLLIHTVFSVISLVHISLIIVVYASILCVPVVTPPPQIYSYVAYILIAVNPYQNLSIYSKEQIDRYQGKSIGGLSSLGFGSLNSRVING